MSLLKTTVVDHADMLRIDASRRLARGQKADLGQFMTPASVAQLMASMFRLKPEKICILDAGAGVGTLSAACIAELCNRERKPKEISLDLYEIDHDLILYLQDAAQSWESECGKLGIALRVQIHNDDFVESAVNALDGGLFSQGTSFDHPNCAILNPPYKKIRSASTQRHLLEKVGIPTSNLYTAFLWLALRLLASGGEIVAITPRSFCNGPYFKSFRKYFLREMDLTRIHSFDSREEAFRGDQVLQENLILHAVKTPKRSAAVLITSSTGPSDEMMSSQIVPYTQVVRPTDPQSFIRILPSKLDQAISETMEHIHLSLQELDLAVSTGRVVDFRARAFLRSEPESSSAPLIYPTHFHRGGITWPKKGRKPNAIILSPKTEELLVPSGYYVLVKRFTSKEERRRIIAVVYDPTVLKAPKVGFENHVNYFHTNGHGLSKNLANGLAAFLNWSVVDSYFRLFNGHTQVNANDLRSLSYPTRSQLEALGLQLQQGMPEPKLLDEMVERELSRREMRISKSPRRAKQKMEEALTILKELGLPKDQQNERSALTLLALLDLKPEMPWSAATNPLRGITPMMEFFSDHYGKSYAPNSRETVRRQTVHQLLEAGLIIQNPDDPTRPVNSGKTVYQVESSALELLRTYGTHGWAQKLPEYMLAIEPLRRRFAGERIMSRIPVTVAPGNIVPLSPGGQNTLIKRIIEEFAPRFSPGGQVLYVGDADEKFGYFDRKSLEALGVSLDPHGKVPDVILYNPKKNWLLLVEAVTSHGPVNPLRYKQLRQVFAKSSAGLVLVTAFLTRTDLAKYLDEISWQTEVWVADSPDHLIHFDGERFLGPYQDKLPSIRVLRGASRIIARRWTVSC